MVALLLLTVRVRQQYQIKIDVEEPYKQYDHDTIEEWGQKV
jgi:hypothetical protein